MTPRSSTLSAIILTQNEVSTLPDCLSSLKGLADEIFVVDSGSQDGTVELAQKAGASVYSHPFSNYSNQRNWALENLPIRTQWVLNLDASERLTEGLVGEILKTLNDPARQVNGYFLRRRTLFMGRWIRFGGHYPNYHLRLFRTGQGHCEDRLYDQHFVVEGAVQTLSHDFIDTVSDDIDTWTLRHLSWARLEANELAGRDQPGRKILPKLFGTPPERRRWLRLRPFEACPILLRPFLYWCIRYFLLLGFLDGKEGLIFHFLQGLWYRFMVDVNLYEMRKTTPPQGETVEDRPRSEVVSTQPCVAADQIRSV